MKRSCGPRTQLLSRLSDALPVGLVQIAADRTITFTNDRLHAIVGSPSAAEPIDALLSGVVLEDKPLLDAALERVLADKPVDDIELRPPGAGPPRVSPEPASADRRRRPTSAAPSAASAT